MIQGIIFLTASDPVFVDVRVERSRRLQTNRAMIAMGNEPYTFSETIANIKEKGYPILLLLPAIIFTVFVTVLPLIFGVLIAFTNYSSPNHLPPRNLVDWVAFVRLRIYSGSGRGARRFTVCLRGR